MNIPEDAIVFLNANRNSRRKRLDWSISAFVQFCKANPHVDAYLLLMTSAQGFYDIGTILSAEITKHKHDCSRKVMSIHTDKHIFTDKAMNEFYNLADVGLNTSTGEGYGLTALEHVSLNKPQVLTHLQCYDTFLSSKDAVFVEPLEDREYYDRTEFSGAWHDTFSTSKIAKAMEEAINLRPSYKAKTWEEVVEAFITHETNSENTDLP
jgi:glycosyltransferase involved in cell wall biosynthesis